MLAIHIQQAIERASCVTKSDYIQTDTFEIKKNENSYADRGTDKSEFLSGEFESYFIHALYYCYACMH